MSVVRALPAYLEHQPLNKLILLNQRIVGELLLRIVLLNKIQKNSTALPERQTRVRIFDGFAASVGRLGRQIWTAARNPAVWVEVGEGPLFDLIELDRLDLIRHLELLQKKDDLTKMRALVEVMDDKI